MYVRKNIFYFFVHGIKVSNKKETQLVEQVTNNIIFCHYVRFLVLHLFMGNGLNLDDVILNLTTQGLCSKLCLNLHTNIV